MDLQFVLEAIVVLAAILMGTRAGGVGVGVWGGLGVAVLVFVFHEPPGEPPISAMLIILAVVTAASLMQAAGGIDWMVKVAAGIISKHPKQITLLAPLTAFAFSVGAGTSNILYPLLPVIYDVSYRNNIRPSRPLSCAVAQSGMALAALAGLGRHGGDARADHGGAVQLRSGPDPVDHDPRLPGGHHRHGADRGPPRARTSTTTPRCRRRSPSGELSAPGGGSGDAAAAAHLTKAGPQLRDRLPVGRGRDRDPRPVPRPSSRVQVRRARRSRST